MSWTDVLTVRTYMYIEDNMPALLNGVVCPIFCISEDLQCMF